MSTLTELVYLNLINVPEPSPELQERVYDFARKTKSSTLMLALIRLKNLTDDLDEKLGVNPSAHVLAEWIARKPRSVEALEAIVLKTKSQKVLRVLADNETLTQETYLKIAQRDEPGASLALYSNPAVSDAVKLHLGPGFGLIVTNDQKQNLSVALIAMPELLRKLLEAPHISRQAWAAISSCGWIAPDTQDLLLERVTQEAHKGFFTRGAQSQALHNLASSQALTVESLTKLLTIAQSVDINGNRIGESNLISMLPAAIERTKSQTSLTDLLKRCTSQEEFEGALNQAVGRRDGYTALPTIVSSPYFNLSSAKYLVPLYGRWGFSDSYYESARGNEEALFALIATFPHRDRTELMERINNPEGMVLRLFEHFQEVNSHHPEWILSSRHLDPSLILSLSLKSLTENVDIPDEVRNRIGDALLKAFKGNATAWETFDSLMMSHEGSIADLIKVVLAICEIEEEAHEKAAPPATQEPTEAPAPKVKASKAEILLGEPLFDL